MGKATEVRRAFKREAVRFLEETGRPLREVATELKVSEGALFGGGSSLGPGPGGLSPTEAAELRRLRREVEILRQERDFLKKATAYFANPSREVRLHPAARRAVYDRADVPGPGGLADRVLRLAGPAAQRARPGGQPVAGRRSARSTRRVGSAMAARGSTGRCGPRRCAVAASASPG